MQCYAKTEFCCGEWSCCVDKDATAKERVLAIKTRFFLPNPS